MTTPASPDPGWFQFIVTAVLTILGGAFTWVQLQVSALRRDNERAESRAVAAVAGLRQEFNDRQTAHERVQDRQHQDNQAEMAASRVLVQANAAVAAADTRRVLDSLDRIGTRLAEIPDRDEVMKLIAATRP